MLGQSPLLDEMMEKLQSKINRELKFHQDLMKLRGALDMTLAQVCLFVLPLLLLFFLFLSFFFPLIILCFIRVCPSRVGNEW
jgi:hypothetical protein